MGRGKVRNGSGLVIHVWHTALRKEQVSARLQAGGGPLGQIGGWNGRIFRTDTGCGSDLIYLYFGYGDRYLCACGCGQRRSDVV